MLPIFQRFSATSQLPPWIAHRGKLGHEPRQSRRACGVSNVDTKSSGGKLKGFRRIQEMGQS